MSWFGIIIIALAAWYLFRKAWASAYGVWKGTAPQPGDRDLPVLPPRKDDPFEQWDWEYQAGTGRDPDKVLAEESLYPECGYCLNVKRRRGGYETFCTGECRNARA